jgi:hypothetical protein
MRSAWHVKELVSVVNNTGWRTADSGLREMDLCQSGFHDPKPVHFFLLELYDAIVDNPMHQHEYLMRP